MNAAYPLRIYHQRALPEGYAGPVFVWDIDKTYLTTHFSSLRGLSRIPLEFAVDKEAIPGMPEVLRGIRRGPGPGYGCAPLYFVTASPPQLRAVLEHKMILDGVEFDGITFKDWWQIVKGRRPGRFLDQLGFKVCALLEGRRKWPRAVEYLFGDDAERDAEAFHLYAGLLSSTVSAEEAADRMEQAGMREDNRHCALALLRGLPRKRGKVRKAFIHLEKGTPPERFEPFAPLVAPVHGALQLCLALFGLGLVDEAAVAQCAEALSRARPARTLLADPEALVADALKRRLISAAKLRALRPVLPASGHSGGR